MNYESVKNMGEEYSNAMWWTEDRYASTINFGTLDANAGMKSAAAAVEA